MEKSTGIPDEISMRDPIEFLEIGKYAQAFLDLALQKLKGGVSNQLLCGHLIIFIQKNGIEAIEKLPRFRSDYWEEIVYQYKKKGVNLLELSECPVLTFDSKIKNTSTEPEELVTTQTETKTETKMEQSQLIETPAKRKKYAEYLIALLQTNFPEFKSEIQLVTKKFNSSSEGFIFSAPKNMNEKIRNFLQKKGSVCFYQSQGKFLLKYPESHQDQKNESKALINLCEKERKGVLGILADENFYAKRGGKGAKSIGVFSVSQSATIASLGTLKINIANKKLDTLNPILKLIKQYYSNRNKKDLVVVEADTINFIIEIKFKPEFFETPKEIETCPDQPVPPTENSKGQHEPEELTVLFDIALETDEKLSLDMAKLQEEKFKNKKELLLSISSLFIDVFWKILEESNIELFKETIGEKGLKNLSQVSLEDLKEPVSLEVSKKLKLF